MKIIFAEDFFGSEISEYLESVLQDGKFAYFSRYRNSFVERVATPNLTPLLEGSENAFTTETFDKMIQEKSRENGLLSSTDMYFILQKCVDCFFASDNEKHKQYMNLYRSLFDLYKLLIEQDITTANIKKLLDKKNKHLTSTLDIFSLYCFYKDKLDEIIKQVRAGNESVKLADIDVVLEFHKADDNFDTFIKSEQREIEQYMKTVDVVIFDGYFVINNDEERFFKTASDLGKEIIVIAKDNDVDERTFESYKQLYTYHNPDTECEVIRLRKDKQEPKTGLEFCKQNFYKFLPDIDDSQAKLYNDDTLQIIEPFLSREDEMSYVVEQIAELINSLDGTDEEIAEYISRNITIVSAYRKGYFFDRLKYHFDKNENLKCKIKVSTSVLKLTDNPVLEYIFSLYSIATYGITPYKFKSLLFSNWYYIIGESDTDWHSFVGDFAIIEPWVEKYKTLPEWIAEIEKIIELKPDTDNELLSKHPFNAIGE
jgi:hypothetical protein